MKWDQWPPPNVNAELQDAFIRHQIYLLRHAGWWGNRATELLADSEDRIFLELRKRKNDNFTKARLQFLLNRIQRLRKAGWQKVFPFMEAQAVELMKYEMEFTKNLVDSKFPVVLDTVTPSAQMLTTLAKKTDLFGKNLRGWERRLAVDDIKRIRSVVVSGISEGKTTAAIARELQRTAYAKTVQETKTLTRTALHSYANTAQREFLETNPTVSPKVRFVATLDARTTLICSGFDGKVFPIKKAPILPLHFNCRSVLVPEVDPEFEIADRPSVPASERGMLRQFSQQNRIRPAVTRTADLPYGTKGKYRQFRREYLRATIQRVPGGTTYNEWLSKQSFEFQEEVLGKKRALLFRKGGLSVDRFTDKSGETLTLKQLAKKESSAFGKAGLTRKE